MAEKRKYLRFCAEGEIKFIPSADPEKIIEAQLADIGFLGLSAHSDLQLELDTIVDFGVYLRALREDFFGRGRVIKCQETKKYRKTFFRITILFIEMEEKKILSLLTRIQDYNNREKRRRWNSGEAGVGLL